MSENGILIGQEEMTLSIVNPFNNQPVVLTLNHFRDFVDMGYSRVPNPETFGRTQYSPFGIPITSGLPNGYTRGAHRFLFNCLLDEEQLLTLKGIFAISENLRGIVDENHYITIRDTRQLFQEPGNTNTRRLASGTVDSTSMPGFVRYFADFYATVEDMQGIFQIADTLAGWASVRYDGTNFGAGSIVYNAVFSMVEGDKLEA